MCWWDITLSIYLSVVYVDKVALESLFDHIEVEDDDTAEDVQSVPKAPSLPRTSAEQQSATLQHNPPSSGTLPQNTAPSRYSCLS